MSRECPQSVWRRALTCEGGIPGRFPTGEGETLAFRGDPRDENPLSATNDNSASVRTAESECCSATSAAQLSKTAAQLLFRLWHVAGVGLRGAGFRT